MDILKAIQEEKAERQAEVYHIESAAAALKRSGRAGTESRKVAELFESYGCRVIDHKGHYEICSK